MLITFGSDCFSALNLLPQLTWDPVTWLEKARLMIKQRTQAYTTHSIQIAAQLLQPLLQKTIQQQIHQHRQTHTHTHTIVKIAAHSDNHDEVERDIG
jgi:hypothetical protein